jgi:hypothetical protein
MLKKGEVMRHFVLVPILCASALLLSVRPASAQFIGTFSWLNAPYCNVITLNVTQTGSVYAVEGFDNLCGADRLATVTGVATLNPNGTVGIGLTIVNPDEVEPSHLDISLSVATLAGTWEDGAGRTGAWTPNGVPVGNPRPLGGVHLTTFGDAPHLIGRRANGTPAAPVAVVGGDELLFLGARGHVGTGISGTSKAQIVMEADQNWTPTARGTRIRFLTTTNGTETTEERLRIDNDGQVGVGVVNPLDQVDVFGNVRVGTAGANGCLRQRDATVLTGTCVSDMRFKRDVTSFEPMLSKVASLRPVHFYWRADEYPSQGFGSTQSYGLMAQEVEEILPELVTTDAKGFKAVHYSKLPLLALQAIKELKDKNDALESQNAEFERRLAELEARLKP